MQIIFFISYWIIEPIAVTVSLKPLLGVRGGGGRGGGGGSRRGRVFSLVSWIVAYKET